MLLLKRRRVFISHRCTNHDFVHGLARSLRRRFWSVIVDPSDPGNFTCLQTEKSIKSSTHFVFLNTPDAHSSRWIQLELLFAKLCYDKDALSLLPVKLDDTIQPEETRELISIEWNTDDDDDELADALRNRIASVTARRRLKLRRSKSHRLKEAGREYERLHWRTGDSQYDLKAIDVYERSIELNMANPYAWANLAWALWKQREDRRAKKHLHVAQLIAPDSRHVQTVAHRINSGQRSMF